MAMMVAGCAQHQPHLGSAGVDGLHSRILTLDAHLDTPMHFARQGWSFGDRHGPETDLVQLDLARMEDGNLDGGFFVIYTAQGPLTAEGYANARDFALRRSDEITRTLARFPGRIELATSAEHALRIAAEGRLVALKSIENSYPIGEDLSLLAEFHRRGVRMAGPVHSTNNQFADSSTDTPRWGGLSPLGRQWVAEMNRLGIVLDASHASDAAFDQMLGLSRTPLLLSHSGSRTVFDHPRNLDDGRIRKLAQAGGAICVTSVYLSAMNLSAERAELFGRLGRIGQLSPDEQAELTRRWRALDERERMWDADFEDFMRALLYVISVAGVDHVCIGMDWDGGGGLAGIEDITGHPRMTERLLGAGYSESDIEKIWSGNVLRVLRAAEEASR
jgi:membrane dipeptidase